MWCTLYMSVTLNNYDYLVYCAKLNQDKVNVLHSIQSHWFGLDNFVTLTPNSITCNKNNI